MQAKHISNEYHVGEQIVRLRNRTNNNLFIRLEDMKKMPSA